MTRVEPKTKPIGLIWFSFIFIKKISSNPKKKLELFHQSFDFLDKLLVGMVL